MKYVGNKVVIVPLDVPVDCTFEHLSDMIYSKTYIDKQKFKLVINCKYPLKSGNRFQPCQIWDDSSVYRMLKLVNTIGMEEIELYIEVVRVNPQANQSVGAYTDLLVGGNDNVANWTMVVDLVALQHLILIDVKYMEMVKTMKMKKIMMNLMKMVMMNLMEI